MDAAARLAWTSAASRRATGKPDAVGIRAVAGHRDRRSRLPRQCRAPAAEIRRPNAFDKIADAAGGITRTHGPC